MSKETTIATTVVVTVIKTVIVAVVVTGLITFVAFVVHKFFYGQTSQQTSTS